MGLPRLVRLVPLSDSRRGVAGRCQLTGPSGAGRDTILPDTMLSADLRCGDRVHLGSAGAYTTAYAPSAVSTSPSTAW